ncbi:hypothetical protein U8C32_09435 [Sinorhizobium medicae]|uniref:hypothetical protein n=1 Tax=Sinorhizobium medicae TaxID=110321 RepID=UPI002AF6C48D|nr:hypothetical protein [Sinorhizobium medicae]WQO47089.1 hypothetical protein U8C42_09290 [Sinorhizobium medicae]WQO63737.1 hypothetical protein U8C40_11010 [Sinorhizobium medicae]WQO74452.1 hypothetical protein U8C31_09425 [Sinorhizobium medicae]WQO93759.1 hypothetical protein U8C32_09435 [Sinorhizobium medicae]
MDVTSTSTDLIITLPAVPNVSTFTDEAEFNKLFEAIQEKVDEHKPDVSTKKGRDEIKSLAHKLAKTKVALDRQGFALTEEWRINKKKVDETRGKIKERLEALQASVRKPVDDWDAAEEARLDALKDRFAALDADRADANCPSDQIRAVLTEIEATEIGVDWQEYQDEAALAKERAVNALRQNLATAEKREADARELEELRALKAAKEEEDRQRCEAEEAAARLRDRSVKARQYIEEVEKGFIGGEPQPYGILIYELERKLPPLIDELGVYADELRILRNTALRSLTLAMQQREAEAAAEAEESRKAAATKAEADAKEAAARKQAEDEERHKLEVEAAAQAERDRIALERKAEEDARAKREADAAHRSKIATDIADALRTMSGRATPEAIAEALIAGKIPHCTVRM